MASSNNAADNSGKFCFAIDRGGTFTDVWTRCPDGRIRILKLLSEDPQNYADAPTEAIRRILEEETGRPHPRGQPVDASQIEWIRMGTTVATNALLERKGERMALLVTEGFRDVLQIGNQARPKIFDLKIEMPDLLYEQVIEVEERVILTNDDMKCQYPELKDSENRRKKGATGDVYILKPLNETRLREDLKRLASAENPIKSIAIVLAHSYTYPEHEKLCGKIARECGFTEVSVSHEVMQMMRMVPRGHTVAVDAYLTPCVKKYVENFRKGFRNGLDGVNVLFMRSDGGLTPMDRFAGSNAIISGPAGGYVGFSMCLSDFSTPQSIDAEQQKGDGDKRDSGAMPILGYDMGGTSTDVSRFDGHFEHVYETELAGVTIQTPQLDIRTVAAGGGSKLHFRSGIFHVGPDSAGAHPGPACYKKGGPLTVTDANLLLGRLRKEYFPSIFGVNANEPLDEDATRAAFEKLRQEINVYLKQSGTGIVGSNAEARQAAKGLEMSVEDIALGFLEVANEAMARPIRSLTQGRGLDSSKHILACFGGAGGQHACQVAHALNIGTVRIHRYSSVLSAVGMAMADVIHGISEPFLKPYTADNMQYIDSRIDELRKQCENKLHEQGFTGENSVKTEAFLNLRYDRTDCTFMCAGTSSKKANDDKVKSKYGNFQTVFEQQYNQQFSFTLPDRTIIVDDIRVLGTGKAVDTGNDRKQSKISEKLKNSENLPAPKPNKTCKVFFKQTGWTDTNLYKLEELQKNYVLHGPCIILDQNSTLLVEPDCEARINIERDYAEIRVPQFEKTEINLDKNDGGDPIQLAIFSHRFMSIAEEMGKVLRRTAISTNIKERLDFSCALFSDDGGLVSNAPHIPVHLGAMQETVRHLIRRIERGEVPVPKSGDVYLSNHPKAGGSHLPDLTVITPVFSVPANDDENYDSESAERDYADLNRNENNVGANKNNKNYDQNNKQLRQNDKNCSDKPIFWTANRGHHADIGGSRPGSMPPDSKTIDMEGAVFDCFHLVRDGQFQEQNVTDALNAPGKVPGCSPTRALADNLADLHAQVAANQKGIGLVSDLIRIYGLRVVQTYMKLIQKNAERAVRDALIKIAADRQKELGTNDADGKLALKYEDFMDDGSILRLRVEIDKKSGSAVFDFGGTTPQVYGNTNCPQAVTKSALIYCLRSLVPYDIPLNQGCLAPVEVIIPEASLLDPDEQAAVVGGNVLTSQRVCDVILGAFGVCAASQGCMNNITFGDESFSYYETVAGGAGAGPDWHGRSGVHTHMTNTRITDIEVMESRYPIMVDRFVLNPGTGGAGQHRGGDGVIRELVFRRPLELSVLTERRVFQPYGLQGGRAGACGANLMLRGDKNKSENGGGGGRLLNLGGKNSITTQAGDKFILMTPGGGGFGAPQQ